MKQLAICTLGLSGIFALSQLPVLASNQPLTASAPPLVPAATAANPTFPSIATPSIQPPVYLAVALTSRTLRPGDSGADVRALQRYLSRNGLYTAEIDGTYGQATSNAVASYQRIRGLSATGIANEETLSDMDFEFLPVETPPASPTTPTTPSRGGSSLLSGNLAPGSQGTDVIALQQRLNSYGIPVFVDGVYGFGTEQGVRTYQRVQGLNVTGTADAATLEAMGFSTPSYRYVAAVIANESQLAEVQKYFPEAYVDRNRRGRFINIGSFAERYPAEARVDAAAARGFSTRVLYR
jgi:peptidoglycan hydrolase-like protein with peptidoglycan-binding domain